MIQQDWEAEGCILTIKDVREKDELKVYWNADTPERSKEVSPANEIFILISGYGRSASQSISLSCDEAIALKNTLDHMIKHLSN